MMKRVLISGASVAGPALAFWLTRYGFQVTVVERSPGIRPGGYAVDFRGSAMSILERMQLVTAIRRHETRTSSISMVNEKDEVVARLPDGFTSGDLEILRGDLAKVLYEATCTGAEYVFDDAIAALSQSEGAVEVAFASGKRRTFDLVVGADGLHSNVRALAFGEESKFVRHMGYYIAIFTVADFMDLGETGRYYLELGKRVGCFGTKNDGKARASFYFASQKMDWDRRDVASQKSLLCETFAGVKWKTAQLLEMLPAAPDFYFDSLSQVKMERWSSGRIILLGDSACCTSPMAGMGTSIAIIGAYVLAGELTMTPDDHAAAFARYEATMREFVDQAQELAEGVSWFIPQTRARLWLGNRMWSWMPQSILRRLMIEQPTRIASIVKPKEYA
jgi:2-polyprenyl-6-methoxyphenol hydroxylase-like FAD-dependent oxidoreductase